MPFSQARSKYAVDFMEGLKLSTGKFAGQPLTLLPWQRDFISDVYGTLNDRSKRQYNYAYLEIPKKNGKSSLGAGIALYHTFADGEQNGEIYGCAGDRAQASLIYDIAVDMLEQDEILKTRSKITLSQKKIKDRLSGSVYKVLSSMNFTLKVIMGCGT
jgi:phage terminase large subunit-like protein